MEQDKNRSESYVEWLRRLKREGTRLPDCEYSQWSRWPAERYEAGPKSLGWSEARADEVVQIFRTYAIAFGQLGYPGVVPYMADPVTAVDSAGCLPLAPMFHSDCYMFVPFMHEEGTPTVSSLIVPFRSYDATWPHRAWRVRHLEPDKTVDVLDPAPTKHTLADPAVPYVLRARTHEYLIAAIKEWFLDELHIPGL
jgi:hypothetical protein